jgi:hypothetical protein
MNLALIPQLRWYLVSDTRYWFKEILSGKNQGFSGEIEWRERT